MDHLAEPSGIKGLSKAKVDKVCEASEKLLVWPFKLVLFTKLPWNQFFMIWYLEILFLFVCHRTTAP
jgi:hypothetical protein